MPLKRWHDVRDVDLPYIESPFFAISKVGHLLENGDISSLELDPLSDDTRLSFMHDEKRVSQRILEDVECGRLCLVLDVGMERPFSPLAEWDGSRWRLNGAASRYQGLSGASKVAQLNAKRLTPADVRNARWPVSAVSPSTPSPAPPERSPEPVVEPPSLVEPGFHIVRASGTREQIKQRLFSTFDLTPEIDAMFERLNPHLGDYLLPGDMVVLADPHSQACREDEEFLMAEAQAIQDSLHSLAPAQRQSMMDHWQAYEDIALVGEASETSSTLSNASSIIGAISAAGSRTIKEAQQALAAIEGLYRQAMDPANPMTRQQFHDLRDQHLRRLELAMGNWVNTPLRLPRYPKLKSRINVEARQQLHGAATARKGGKFRIPTISEAIARTTLVAKLTSIGGFVGLGLDTAATQSKIERACSDGRELECTRIKYIEYGGLAGRATISALGGGAGGASGAKICLAASLSPHGRLVCGIVGAVAGAVAGEKIGDKTGRGLGLFLREFQYDIEEANASN